MNHLIFVVAALLSGCVGIYQQPAETQPHAILKLELSGNELMHGGAQLFYSFDNSDCKSTKGAALAGLSWATKEKTVRLSTKNRIYIQAATSGIKPDPSACAQPSIGVTHQSRRNGTKSPPEIGICVTYQTCVNVVSFTPEPGKSYLIRHNLHAKHCTVSLIDKETNAMPLSFEGVAVSDGCKL